jgi:hypothetical protein
MPASRAIDASRDVSGGTPSRGSSCPLAKMTAERAPAAAAADSCSSRTALGRPRMARSIGPGTAATDS